MLLAAALATALIAQADPAPPTVTTGAAQGVTTSAATVAGTVDPNGEATTYHVEYGTSATHGLRTPESSPLSGTAPVPVKVALSRLTQDTTYHYVVVATNAAGTTYGADRTLHTPRRPEPPVASTRAATQKGPLSAVVHGLITPRGLPTTVHFIYGPTTAYGLRTPDVAVGAGWGAVRVSATVAGLRPHTRYHFRAIATNAAGMRRGGDRSFRTARAPTGVVITPSTTRVRWGRGLQITGAVTGQGSVPIALERQDAPYDGPFVQVATSRAARNGSFTFYVAPLRDSARLRVTTLTPPVVAASAARTIRVAVKVGITARKRRHDRVRISGTIWPEVPHGRVSLQRRSRHGHWHTIRHARPHRESGGRSRYHLTIRRTRHRQSLRALVVAHDDGRHHPGHSRRLRIARKR